MTLATYKEWGYHENEGFMKTIISPDKKRVKRVPPGQRLTEGLPILHYGEAPMDVELKKWRFSIFGLVDRKRQLTHGEFMKLPRVRVESDVHCVTRWSSLDHAWEGVSTSEIKNLVAINPEARYVVVHAYEGFTTNLPIGEFFSEDALFAFRLDGEDISVEHGWPLRLVVPRLYFWKSAKWAEGVEFTAEDRPGFWEQNGYHNHGDPWKEERFG